MYTREQSSLRLGLAVMLLSILLTACDSAGDSPAAATDGGSKTDGTTSAALAVGQFTRTFNTADSGSNTIPFHNSDDHKVQFLYTASEIKSAGNITTLRFRRGSNTVSAITCPNVTIKLGHTSLAALTTAFTSNVQQGKGTQATSLNNTSVTIPVGLAGTWFDITLTTPFYFNGADNLVVEIERTTKCTATQTISTYTAASNRRAQAAGLDTSAGVAQHNPTTADGVDTTQPWMQFIFAGGDEKIVAGGTSITDAGPFITATTNNKVQLLYTAAEINGSGPITGIAVQVHTLTTAQQYTLTFKIGHSKLTDLTTDLAGNFSGAVTALATDAVFTVPAGVPAGSWLWLPVSTGVFAYNGTDNLLLEIDVTDNSSASGILYIETLSGYSRKAVVYGDHGSTTASAAYPYFKNAMLRFNGGKMSVISGDTTLEANVLSNTNSGKVQFFYRAAELGSAIVITGIACRLGQPSTAADYYETEITLAHLTDNYLSTTFVNNLIGGTTVYKGLYKVTAGTLKGDWLEVPFAVPFAYNGKDNLVVQWASNADSSATGPNSCSMQVDATHYSGRRIGHTDRGNSLDDGTQNNAQLNTRFTIKK